MAVTIDQMNVDVQPGAQGQGQGQPQSGQGQGQAQGGSSAPEPLDFRKERGKVAERELRLKAD